MTVLLGCPFCGDRMMDHHGTIMHVKRDDCIIAVHGYIAEWADRWNTCALASPEGKAPEPVAWKWELAGGISYHPFAPRDHDRQVGWTATPLYASPPISRTADQDEIRRMQEACARAAESDFRLADMQGEWNIGYFYGRADAAAAIRALPSDDGGEHG